MFDEWDRIQSSPEFQNYDKQSQQAIKLDWFKDRIGSTPEFQEYDEQSKVAILNDFFKPEPKDEGNILSDIPKAFTRGLDVAGESIGGTMEMFGVPGGKYVKELYGQRGARPEIQRPGYLQQGTVIDKPERLLDPRWYANIVTENIPNMLMMLAPGAAGYRGAKALGAGANLAKTAGTAGGAVGAFGIEAGSAYNTAKESLLSQGYDPDKAEKIATTEGVAVGIVNSLLEVTPFHVLLKNPGGKKLLGRIVRQAILEGGTEGAQENINLLAETIGHGKNPGIKDWIGRTVESSIAGAVMGGPTGIFEAKSTPKELERDLEESKIIKQASGQISPEADAKNIDIISKLANKPNYSEPLRAEFPRQTKEDQAAMEADIKRQQEQQQFLKRNAESVRRQLELEPQKARERNQEDINRLYEDERLQEELQADILGAQQGRQQEIDRTNIEAENEASQNRFDKLQDFFDLAHEAGRRGDPMPKLASPLVGELTETEQNELIDSYESGKNIAGFLRQNQIDEAAYEENIALTHREISNKINTLTNIWDNLKEQDQEKVDTELGKLRKHLEEFANIDAKRSEKEARRSFTRMSLPERIVEAQRQLKEADRLGLNLENRSEIEKIANQKLEKPIQDQLKKTGIWEEPNYASGISEGQKPSGQEIPGRRNELGSGTQEGETQRVDKILQETPQVSEPSGIISPAIPPQVAGTKVESGPSPAPPLQKNAITEGQKRAKIGGEFGANGEWYEGGKFIATKDRPKQKKRWKKPTGRQNVEPNKWASPPETADNIIAAALYPQLGGIEIKNPDGTFSLNKKLSGEYSDPDVIKTRESNINAWNNGARWRLVEVDENGKRTPISDYMGESGEKIESGITELRQKPIDMGGAPEITQAPPVVNGVVQPERRGTGPQTLRGRIKSAGNINFLNFKGELENMPTEVKFLSSKNGTPIDLLERTLKDEGWISENEDLLDVLTQGKTILKRGKVISTGTETRTAEQRSQDRKLERESIYEPEAPPSGEYVEMKAEDLPEGAELTIIDGNSKDGWDEYKVINKDPFSVTLKDGTTIELGPLDRVQVRKSDLPKDVSGAKQQEIINEEPQLFEEPEKAIKPNKIKRNPSKSDQEQNQLFGYNQTDMFGTRQKSAKPELSKYEQDLTPHQLNSVLKIPIEKRLPIQEEAAKHNAKLIGYENGKYFLHDNETGSSGSLVDSVGQIAEKIKENRDEFNKRKNDTPKFKKRINDRKRILIKGRDTRAKKLTSDLVQQIADALSEKWENAPDIEVVSSQSSLPDGVKSFMKEGDIVDGVFYNGKVYLISDNLIDKDHVVKTIIHESFGHYGVRNVLGSDFDSTLKMVYSAKKDEADSIAKEYGFDVNTEKGRLDAADEWLARHASENKQSSWIDRIIAAIRKWARSIFPGIRLSNSELRMLLDAAMENVKNIESENIGAKNLQPKFSKSKKELTKEIDDSNDYFMGEFKEPESDTTMFERVFSVPMYHFKKHPALRGMYDSMIKWMDDKVSIFKNVMDDESGNPINVKIESLKKDKYRFKKFNDYLLKRDRDGMGYSVVKNGDGWSVKNPPDKNGGAKIDKKFKSWGEAWTAARVYEAEDSMSIHGFDQEMADRLVEFRAVNYKTYKLFRDNARRVVQKYIDAGKKPPQVVYKTKEGDVKISIEAALAKMGDRQGYYFPRLRTQGRITLIAKKEGSNPVRKHFDIGAINYNKSTAKAIANYMTPMMREYRRLKRDGYKVEMMQTEKLPEDVWLDLAGQRVAMNAVINKSLENITSESDKDIDMLFFANLAEQIANMEKARGSRSRMIARADLYGKDVWLGYEEDSAIALTRSVQSAAGGEAKRIMAEKMVKSMMGLTETWEEFQERKKAEGLKPEKDEWKAEVDARKVDPAKQPNAYKDGMSYMRNALRNDEFADRIMGQARALAVLKYLGFRLSAPLINLTALPTTVVATYKAYGIPFKQAPVYMGKAMAAWLDYNKGKSTGDWKEIFDHIVENGLHKSQYNTEAMGVLKNKAGRKLEQFLNASMWMFGKTEQLNRLSTIAGAAKWLKENGKEGYLDTALEISNRAHGVYGKANYPYYARGSDIGANVFRSFYVFKTFSHNYILNLKEMFGEKQYKAALYMALSPAVLAGAGASVITPAVSMMLKAFGVDEPEEEFYRWVASEFGTNLEGIARYGATYPLGVNLKGSLSIGITDLPTSFSDFLGAPGSMISDVYDGGKSLIRGDYIKGFEKLSINATGSIARAYREYTEGVTTRNNAPIFFGDQPLKGSVADTVLRALSFNPSDISTKREMQYKEYGVSRKYTQRRTDIYAKIKKHYLQPEEKRSPEKWAKILLEIEKYNEDASRAITYVPKITAKSIKTNIRRSFKPSKIERERGTK